MLSNSLAIRDIERKAFVIYYIGNVKMHQMWRFYSPALNKGTLSGQQFQIGLLGSTLKKIVFVEF